MGWARPWQDAGADSLIGAVLGAAVVGCMAGPASAEVPQAAPVVRRSAAGVAVVDAFEPPPGFRRLAKDDFGTWLGQQTLADAADPVRTHDGRVVGHRARVMQLPLVRGDLQQCADTLIRWRATWLRSEGLPVSFHATSGDALPWTKVTAGQVPYESGGRIAWKAGSAGWERYLGLVFTWAGTASVARHDTVPIDEPVAGAVLVDPGFPGHAAQILDVASDGEHTLLLVAEGFMPAMDAHVELGPNQGWWVWDDGLSMYHWRFESASLRAWR